MTNHIVISVLKVSGILLCLAISTQDTGSAADERLRSTPQESVAKMLTSDRLGEVADETRACKSLPVRARIEVLHELSTHFSDKKDASLVAHGGFAVFWRVKAGLVKDPPAMGVVYEQDVFTVGGRAAMVAEELSGLSLPTLEARQTGEEWSERASNARAQIEAYVAGAEAVLAELEEERSDDVPSAPPELHITTPNNRPSEQ